MFILSTGTGIYLSSRLDKRVRLLEELIVKLDEAETMIRCCSTDISDVFAVFKELQQFTDCSCNSNNMNSALQKLYILDESDKEILSNVFRKLGRSDTDGQLSMLEMNRKLLESRLEKARADYLQKGRMYRSVGILSGIGIAVILI